MSVIKFNRNFSTLFSWDTDDNPTTEQDYQNAVKNWTETEMNIVDTLLWQPTTEYATGNIVKTPSLPSQYVLKCAETGTSGSTEPDYSGAGAGDTVNDGTVTWVIVSLATGNVADVDAGNIGVNAEVDNSEAWASAIGGGAIAEDDGRLVKGDTVYAVTSVMETNIATNTEAIEENTENIATNTENIAQNTTDIDIADKRISNIEKLLQGNLYDYQTDSDSKYVKTVPAGAMPYASLNSIGGKTLVWNQTFELSMLRGNTTVYGVTSERTDNGIRLYGAFTSNVNLSIIGSWYDAVVGHKYLITNTPISESLTLRVTQNGAYANCQENTPFTATDTHTYLAIKPLTLNANFDVTWTPQIFDLTLMFGAGNEPTTYAEFQQMFPASYYSYNAGTLLSAGVTEVVSKKADTTTLATYPIPAEIQALEGYGWSAGQVYNYIDYEAKKFIQNVGSRAYASGDESDATVITDGTTTYYPLNPAIETDISQYLTDDNLIEVEANGTLAFPNSNGDDYRIPVPSAETYMVDLQSALGE